MALQYPLGINVWRIREHKGWSQEKFAEMAGLDRTYISGIERCIRNPTVDVIERLAEALGVPPAELFKE